VGRCRGGGRIELLKSPGLREPIFSNLFVLANKGKHCRFPARNASPSPRGRLRDRYPLRWILIGAGFDVGRARVVQQLRSAEDQAEWTGMVREKNWVDKTRERAEGGKKKRAGLQCRLSGGHWLDEGQGPRRLEMSFGEVKGEVDETVRDSRLCLCLECGAVGFLVGGRAGEKASLFTWLRRPHTPY